MNWLKRQVQELQNDVVVRVYGGFLSLTHLITAILWSEPMTFQALAGQVQPICWPTLPICDAISPLDVGWAKGILGIYGLLAVLVAGLFSARRLVWAAYIGFAGLTVMKLALMAIDLRLALSAHTVVLWISFIFLCLPNKRAALKGGIAVVYMIAAATKLNESWLSGDNIPVVPDLFTAVSLPLLTTAVIFVEVVGSLLLLAAKRSLMLVGLAAFAVFHAVSYAFIGWAFPAYMAALLALFVLDAWSPSERRTTWNPRHWPTTWALAVAAFVSLQILPRTWSSDPDLTGEGKYLTLYMFDRIVHCTSSMVLYKPDGSTEDRVYRPPRDTQGRLSCNPVSFFWRSKALCRRGAIDDVAFIDFDLKVDSGYRGKPMTPRLRLSRICQTPLEYKAWGHNRWILPPTGDP